MIIQTINKNDFHDAFNAIRPNTFTYEGLNALYEYLDDIYDESNPCDLDVIALCCEFTEYESAYDAMFEYQPEDMPTVDNSEGMDLIEIQEATEKLCLDWLNHKTQVIELSNGGVIIQDF